MAIAEGRIVGFRTFSRWELERGGEVVRAARAVDTATDPAWQRRGIFSRLTRHALEELAADGVAFVFNTPNAKSRPGYLKLGWVDVGRVPVSLRPSSAGSLLRLVRDRRSATAGGERWSLDSPAGEPAVDVLADHDGVAALLASQPGGDGLRTRRTPEYLSWRYGFGPLAYRAVPAGTGAAEGFVIVRVRRRASAVEAALCEVLVPGAERSALRRALGRAAAAVEADYLLLGGRGLALPGSASPARLTCSAGFLPVPGQGPRLVWRGLTETVAPALPSWRVGLGDMELF